MLEAPLPWMADREPSEAALEREAQGFMDLLARTGGA